MSAADTGRPMSKLVYRSRAAKALSAQDVHELTRTSQARNEREAITGLMVYDNDCFFQWIEGPAENVDRVMHSIRNDERHTEIEVLGHEQIAARAFDGWSMKLATPGPILAPWRRDVIEPPRKIVEDLRRRPELASALLVMLGPGAKSQVQETQDLAHQSLSDKTAAIVKAVFLSAVVPELQDLHLNSIALHVPVVDPRARELADLLVSSDQAAALELIEELRCGGLGLTPMFATLFEPAARQLGDLWDEDLCTEFDVALGLCRLQTAARFLSADVQRPGGSPGPAVLIVPEPGEIHRLGAALDGGVLRKAGWSPHCDYPSNDQALQDVVSTAWFDVLDLSLSVAFRREHRLAAMGRTIASVRRASCNRNLVVMVGGRVFRERDTAGSEVGADLVVKTAADVEKSILNTVTSTRAATPSPSAELQVLATYA